MADDHPVSGTVPVDPRVHRRLRAQKGARTYSAFLDDLLTLHELVTETLVVETGQTRKQALRGALISANQPPTVGPVRDAAINSFVDVTNHDLPTREG
jgi:hypothetical protein